MAKKSPVSYLRDEIIALGNTLSLSGILIDKNHVVSERLGGRTVRLAWDGYDVDKEWSFATAEEYLKLLRDRQYSFLLFDGSLIQLVYVLQSRRIIKHSLGYYPSPVPLTLEEWESYRENGLALEDILTEKFEKVGVGLFDLVKHTYEAYVSSTISNSQDLRLKSPIRFDFEEGNNTLVHPGSHLHLSERECRIPVFAPLSVGHFVHFVFRHFYSTQWTQLQILRDWKCDMYDEIIIDEHRTQLHIGCVRAGR